MKNTTNEKEIKDANRRFYNAVADNYEAIDQRRSRRLENWLKTNLIGIRAKAPGGRLLDLGTGSGFVTRCALGIFDERIGVDISPAILEANKTSFDLGVAADLDNLPFKDNSFDAVSCFAVLHHLFSFERLVTEAARVLKPGGVFYSDHDMSMSFYNRFKLPLWCYRKLQNTVRKYTKASGEITEELYHLSEYHENGIDPDQLLALMNKNGFGVELNYHWFGLNGITDKFLGNRFYSRGFAPLARILAVKKML